MDAPTVVYPKFVIGGTGRSGSGYISQLLTNAGVPCGHESVFNPQGAIVAGLLGDSSWCAGPSLENYGGLVFHQVRHPLKVIASLVAVPPHGPYKKLRESIVGPPDGDPVSHAMRTYVAFNELVEPHAVRRWQLEQIDALLVRWIGAQVGVEVGEVTMLGPYNHHNVAGLVIAWDDLPDGTLRDRLLRMARRYGYETEGR